MCNPGNASESYLDLDLPHNLASPEVRPDGLTYVWSDSEKPNVSGERSHSPAYHVPIPLAGQLFWGTEFSCFSARTLQWLDHLALARTDWHYIILVDSDQSSRTVFDR